MTKTALYRYYDADGRLLYVGISLSVIERTASHAANSDWFWNISTMSVEWFDDRTSAEVAEAAAIRSQKPLHNKAHVCKSPAQVFIDTVGVPNLARRLGVSVSAVNNARYDQSLPTSWARIIAQICIDTGITCPSEAFSWRGGGGSGTCISAMMRGTSDQECQQPFHNPNM